MDLEKMKNDYIDLVIAELVLHHGYSLKDASETVSKSPLRYLLDKYPEPQLHTDIAYAADELLEMI